MFYYRPFWLSPRQAIIVTIADKPEFTDYAKQVHQQLWDAGFDCDIDQTDHTLQKKVREAQLAQYNFILVIGEREVQNKVVNVRTRDNVVHGERSVEALIDEFHTIVKEFK
jgi:threonyl-tRNA synthetase